MTNATGRPGRPRAITREMLAEAACELFLEKGYDETSVTEIATRAGIARSSFFNYAATKAELLWGGLDERIAGAGSAVDAGTSLAAALRALADDFAPDALALAIGNAATMRIESHIEHEAALRMWRIAALASRALQRDGATAIEADVRGGSYGAAVMTSIRSWALSGAGASLLSAHLDRALAAV